MSFHRVIFRAALSGDTLRLIRCPVVQIIELLCESTREGVMKYFHVLLSCDLNPQVPS